MISDLIKERIAFEKSEPNDITVRPHADSLRNVIVHFGLHEFLGDYFSDDFRSDINIFLEEIALGTRTNYAFWQDRDDDPRSCVFEKFAQQDITRKVRPRNESPFSKETTIQLNTLMNEHPTTALTMIAIQKSLGAFFLHVGKDFEIGRVSTPPYMNRFLDNSTILNSFVGELLPHILLSMNKSSNNETEESHYSNGLKESFSRSAWKAYINRGPGHSQGKGKTTVICPFSRFVTDLWNTAYEPNADGILTPTGEKRDGAFPAMVARRIQELESNGTTMLHLKL